MAEIFLTMTAERNSEGGNYFHEACKAGSIPLLCRVEPFIQVDLLQVYDYEGSQPIHVAVKTQVNGCAANMIGLLIMMGADINGKEGLGGDTALHLAIHKNDHDLVEWPCDQKNLTIDALNHAHKTPYQLAWTKGDRRLMKILEDHGADTEPPSDSGSDDDSN